MWLAASTFDQCVLVHMQLDVVARMTFATPDLKMHLTRYQVGTRQSLRQTGLQTQANGRRKTYPLGSDDHEPVLPDRPELPLPTR